LSISGEELEETEIPGFDSQHQTIFCGNVGEDQAIQARCFRSPRSEVCLSY
jgi:hypothetical protein